MRRGAVETGCICALLLFIVGLGLFGLVSEIARGVTWIKWAMS